jgi:hypothetical protein
VAESPTCSKCDQNPAGPGGILCPPCLEKIKAVRLPGVPT